MATPFKNDSVSALREIAPASGFVVIPAHSSPALTVPTRGLVVTGAGNLGVVCADGSSNDSALIAVTVGMQFSIAVVGFSTSNTAAALGYA